MTTAFDIPPCLGGETPPFPSDPGAARAPRVLFAAYPGGRPTGALLRAHAFASIFGGQITLLRILPGGAPTDVLFPHQNILGALMKLERLTNTVRRTRLWSDATLPESLPDRHLLVRDGDFEATVVEVALAIGADFIVLPPAEGQSGRRVTSIAAKTRVPVLVAREAMSSETVVAATNLRDNRYPVLNRALDIATRLGASVALVHNVSAPEIDDACSGNRGMRLTTMTNELERRRRRLLLFAEGTGTDIEPVVLSRASAAEAIVHAARERDADLVVVGTRAIAELDEDVHAGTAGAVVESTRRSILVLPFAESRSA